MRQIGSVPWFELGIIVFSLIPAIGILAMISTFIDCHPLSWMYFLSFVMLGTFGENFLTMPDVLKSGKWVGIL